MAILTFKYHTHYFQLVITDVIYQFKAIPITGLFNFNINSYWHQISPLLQSYLIYWSCLKPFVIQNIIHYFLHLLQSEHRLLLLLYTLVKIFIDCIILSLQSVQLSVAALRYLCIVIIIPTFAHISFLTPQ
jgi:hypothetical protein